MDTDFARQQMVEQQVRAWDVLHPDVLQVLKNIPREQFVPTGFESLAFADTEIPIGHDQSMMTPTIEGRVLQSLNLSSDDKVLEIGTGTGFLAACMRRLSAEVTSIEIHDDFLVTARTNLEDTGINDVKLLHMDATSELPDGKFDAIAVTGSVEKMDQRFADALTIGGRMFIVVGTPPAMDARLITRIGDDEWETQSLFETVLAPLVNGTEPPRFFF